MVVQVINDQIAVAVALLDNPMWEDKMLGELQLYTASPVFAIWLVYFETIPKKKKKSIFKYLYKNIDIVLYMYIKYA